MRHVCSSMPRNFRVIRQRAGQWVMGLIGCDVRAQDTLTDNICPWCQIGLEGQLPRVCMNCYHLGTADNGKRRCLKGVMFPIIKGTCYRYEGWL